MKTKNMLSAHVLPFTAVALTLLVPALLAQGPGRGNGPGPGLTALVLPLPEAQAKTLQFMREEEKLARDIYKQLGEKWDLTVFRNIADSEEMHFKAVGTLLERYGVSDPASGAADGVFRDATLAALYPQFMAKGGISVQDALEVGVLIEKTDIADLEKSIAASDRADIKRVYTNLMNASYAHLEAFETNVEAICRR